MTEQKLCPSLHFRCKTWPSHWRMTTRQGKESERAGRGPSHWRMTTGQGEESERAGRGGKGRGGVQALGSGVRINGTLFRTADLRERWGEGAKQSKGEKKMPRVLTFWIASRTNTKTCSWECRGRWARYKWRAFEFSNYLTFTHTQNTHTHTLWRTVTRVPCWGKSRVLRAVFSHSQVPFWVPPAMHISVYSPQIEWRRAQEKKHDLFKIEVNGVTTSSILPVRKTWNMNITLVKVLQIHTLLQNIHQTDFKKWSKGRKVLLKEPQMKTDVSIYTFAKPI